MNEFYTNLLRRACNYLSIDYCDISDVNDIICQTLDELSPYEREFIQVLYPIHSSTSNKSSNNYRFNRISQTFGLTHEKSHNMAHNIRNKLFSSMIKKLKKKK